MILHWGHDEAVARFVAERTSVPRGFGECKAAAVSAMDGSFAAGLVFHNYDPESELIEISAAALDPRWAQRSVLRAAMDYVYKDCGCQAAFARCSPKNYRVRRLWGALGATEHIIPRMRGRDENGCILMLTDTAWAASKLARF